MFRVLHLLVAVFVLFFEFSVLPLEPARLIFEIVVAILLIVDDFLKVLDLLHQPLVILLS